MTKLPNCALCGSEPRVSTVLLESSKPSDVIEGCDNDACPLHDLNWSPMTPEQWTRLHKPAEVLRSMSMDLMMEARDVAFHLIKQKIDEFELIDKARDQG